MCHYVDGFISTPVGEVPRISTKRSLRDWAETAFARSGLGRNNYIVVPGLYAIGSPDATSEVIVTANYKLTFDTVREQLGGQNVWLVILDTRGINVWCAAGKNLFSTEEVINRINRVQLHRLVSHRRVLLPQLGAPGVAAHLVRKATGFTPVYSTIRAEDMPAFLAAGNKATEEMREVTFTLAERAVLVPVEIYLMLKTVLVAFACMFVLSGIGPGIFSLQAALQGLSSFAWATLFGVMGGHVAVPLLLPYLPPKAFSQKGVITGAVAALCMLPIVWGTVSVMQGIALCLWTVSMSSFLGMNFTGSTPYTSPSGVEFEMRKAIPFQFGAVAVAIVLWIVSAFVGGV